jgi:G8 domain
MVFSFKLAIRTLEVCLASLNRVINYTLAAILSIACGLAAAQCPFNVTGGAVADALRDGLALARVAVSIDPITGASNALVSPQVTSAIAANEAQLDINGNGEFDAVDAAVIVRHLFGFRSQSLLVGNAGIGAKRTSGDAMQAFIDGGCVAATSARKKLSVMKAEQMPQNNGGVFISVLDDVEIDQDIDLAWLEIQGSLVCTDRNLALSSRWIMVHGGTFRCGTPVKPFNKKLTVTLTGTDPSERALGMNMGTKVFGVMHSGSLHLFAEQKRAWTKLAAQAAVGATQITLRDAPQGWKVGDSIAIATTDSDPLGTEKRTITAINGNTVSFTQPLVRGHWGGTPEIYSGHTLDMRAEVANLTRNIVVTSAQNEDRVLPGFDPDSFDASGKQNGDGKRLEVGRFGGHMMFMEGSKVRLHNIEVTQMGQQGMLGRYPVHWHLAQDTSAGSFIKNSAIHSTFQRGIVVHQSNALNVDSNVVFDVPGHAVFLEDGIERNSTFHNNLVMGVKYVLRKHRLSLKDPGNENENRAERQAGFWITNPQNVFTKNVVAGVENGWGFIFADVRSDKLPVIARTLQTFAPNSRLLTFKDNVAHSIGFLPGAVDGGKAVFNLGYGPEEAGSCFRFDERGIVDDQAATSIGNVAYKCRNAAFWSTNFKPVVGSVIADSRSGIINNQGEPPASLLHDSLIVAHSANNALPQPALDFGPFTGPNVFETLEAGPALFSNVVAVGQFKDSDNSTPQVTGAIPSATPAFSFRAMSPSYLRANSSVSVPITIERHNGFTGQISLSVAIPKLPNLSADNPYYYVTSDPLTIAAGATTATLVLRNLAHPKPGDGHILLLANGGATIASGDTTIASTLPLFTTTAPATYSDAATGNNVARLFANTGSPRNPSLSAMEFNRGAGGAMDGNLDTYAHTSGTPLPWLQLDLLKSYRLREVRLKSSATISFGNLWVFTSDFPIFNHTMTLQDALNLPTSMVKRYEVPAAVGTQTTITLPAGDSGRVIRIWGKQPGEMKVPEMEVIAQ